MKKLKEIREEKQITQRELADALGVTVQTVWNWEHGVRGANLDRAAAIAKALGCKVDDLIDKEG